MIPYSVLGFSFFNEVINVIYKKNVIDIHK